MNVYEKINALRVEVLANATKKTGKGPYFQYFELKDFLPFVLKQCKEIGLFGQFSVSEGTANLTLVNVEKPDETVVFTAPFGGCALPKCHEAQNVGASITYMRRYLWGCVIELIEHDAIDASQSDWTPKAKPTPTPAPKKAAAAAPIGIPVEEFEAIREIMPKCETLDELKDMFSQAWRRASSAQKNELNKIKELTKRGLLQ